MRLIELSDALDVVDTFDAMAYFTNVSGPARKVIAESLVRLVNPADPTKPFACKRSPHERLKTFAEAFLRVPGGWPGIGEMEALYCMLFPPGDGIERGSPVTPGYTFEDHASGNYTPMLPAAPEPQQKQIAAPEVLDAEAVEDTRSLNEKLETLRLLKSGSA